MNDTDKKLPPKTVRLDTTDLRPSTSLRVRTDLRGGSLTIKQKVTE